MFNLTRLVRLFPILFLSLVLMFSATYQMTFISPKNFTTVECDSPNLDTLNVDLGRNLVPTTEPPASHSRSKSDSLKPRADLVTFTNVTPTVGLGGISANFFAWGDYNNDGNQDLLVNGGRLFRNSGPPGYKFTEVTSSVGLTGGGNGAWADYDNDGNLDLYCTGNDILWHNEGPPNYNFKDVTTDAGNIRNEYPTTAVGWGDYDLDGYLDLYIANGEVYNDGNPSYYPDYLYHNNGDGTFTNVTAESNIRSFGGPYYGRGVAWGDYNDDGWLDVYISNYRISQNWLFQNNGNGTFTDVSFDKGVTGEESQRLGNTYYGHTVGSAWGDLDNDGDLDLFESNLVHKDLYRGPICGDSQLYRNDGPANDYQFTDVREDSNIPEKSIGGGQDELFVGIAIADFDNDGYLDLFIPQIYDLDYSYSYLYRNNGDWTFTNVSDEVGVLVWNTYGGAWCDFNNDGFLDLVTGGKGSADPNASYEVHLYRNNGNFNSWLQVKLKGNHYNEEGIGVRVKVSTASLGITQTRELEGGMGCHSSQNSIPVEFGFGSYSGLVDVMVQWPSGYIQKISDVNLNQLLIVEETNQAPDVQFINFKTLEQYPVQGDKIILDASIANMGYVDADSIEVRFFLDKSSVSAGGMEIGEAQVINDLKRFQSMKINTTWDTTGITGTHELWAVIGDVLPPELDITNNDIQTTVNIRTENQAPQPSLVVSPVIDLDLGDVVLFDGSNSTDDVVVSYYYYDFGDGNNSKWITNSKIEYQYWTFGTFTASLRVKDNDGAISTKTAKSTITIRTPPIPNRAPVINKFSANPIEVESLGDVTLKIIASDPDDDQLTYQFSAVNGKLDYNELVSSATWHAPENAGIYEISARVFDGEYYSEDATVQITVFVIEINHYPVIDNIEIVPSKVTTGSLVTIIVDAEDPDIEDNTKLSYDYEAYGGSIIGKGSQVTWQAPDEPGVYFITITVIDPGGLAADDEVMVDVLELNIVPQILEGVVTPNTITNDKAETVLFTIMLEDQNGLDDIDSVTIGLSVLGGHDDQALYDNGKNGDTQSSDGVYSLEFFVSRGVSSGIKQIRVTVKDLAGESDTYDLYLEIKKGKSEEEPGVIFTPGFDTILIVLAIFVLTYHSYYLKNSRRQ